MKFYLAHLREASLHFPSWYWKFFSFVFAAMAAVFLACAIVYGITGIPSQDFPLGKIFACGVYGTFSYGCYAACHRIVVLQKTEKEQGS